MDSRVTVYDKRLFDIRASGNYIAFDGQSFFHNLKDDITLHVFVSVSDSNEELEIGCSDDKKYIDIIISKNLKNKECLYRKFAQVFANYYVSISVESKEEGVQLSYYFMEERL